MSFKLELSKNKFTIINIAAETVFSGTVYDYNNIEFNTSGFLRFLQDYLQFESPNADYIFVTISNWVEFHTLTTKE